MRNKPTDAIDLQTGAMILGLSGSRLLLIRGGLHYRLKRRIESVERRFQQQGVGLLISPHPIPLAGH